MKKENWEETVDRNSPILPEQQNLIQHQADSINISSEQSMNSLLDQS